MNISIKIKYNLKLIFNMLYNKNQQNGIINRTTINI